MELPDRRYYERAEEVLADLVRIDSTNPPGNEVGCAVYLRDLLSPVGAEIEIIEPARGRGNLVARLRGSGQGKPLMLMGHLDVVPADADTWTYPPFGAQIHDGFMWGRGTTDMKQMVAVCAVIMLAMAQSGATLRRDLLLVATADEEKGGRMGMGWLARERPELLDVSCAINEGGGGAIQVGDETMYTCQTAEKGLCRTVWTARAEGGHASHPRSDMSTAKLAQAVSLLGDGHLEGRCTVTMRRAMGEIARSKSLKTENKVGQLLDRGRIEEALRTAGLDDDSVQRYRPLFYDTASVTGLRAGDPRSINVIPPVATAYVDGRILPGQTEDGFLGLLRDKVGDLVDVEVYQEQFSPGLESSASAPIFQVMADVIAERCGGAPLIPWQCAGATDAKNLVSLGVPVYGFVPARPLPEGVKGAGAHANDERLWLENLAFALDILYDVTSRYCCQG